MTISRYTLALATALLIAPTAVSAQQNPALIGEGARVYAANCGRCHNARPATERTDAQWQVIVSHMRARANLTRTEADAVLAFLQATNLPPGQEGGGDGAALASLRSTSSVMPSALAASLHAALLARATRASEVASRPNAVSPQPNQHEPEPNRPHR